jgi:hypothetical protein
MRSIDRLIGRHRRGFALLGMIVVLGVAALNVHEALPEHHEAHGSATMCVAAMSIAVLAAFAWRTRRSPAPMPGIVLAPRVQMPSLVAVGCPLPAARAGPPGPVVLRR